MISSPAPRDAALPVNPMMEQNCPCTRDCPRHGNCFACVANHRDNMHILPACLREKECAPHQSGD